jgi:hypothetical protein
VWGDPPGADVLFNGRPVGKLPTTGRLRVEVGPLTVTVRARGFVETTRTVEVKRAAQLRERVALAAEPPPSETAPSRLALAAPPPDQSETTTALVSQPGAFDGEAAGRPIYARWWFWTAIAVVAAGGVAAAVLLTRNHSPCDPNTTCSTWGS